MIFYIYDLKLNGTQNPRYLFKILSSSSTPSNADFTMKIGTLAVLAFVVSAVSAVRCQDEGSPGKYGFCHGGGSDCPGGTHSVFWDTGCHSGSWWNPWDKDDKCCVAN
ncbi:hypothetical protein BGZ73_008070 [Actinomortierella ambigua]|nr:hypothetical protein BGZ73_008070 [Actinomortierella ambigua]